MKKILSFVLFAVIFAAFGVSSFAAESAEISFNTVGPDENGKVFVDVVISGSSEPSMLQFCVAYDSEKLDCVSVNAGNAFSGNLAPTINAAEGKIFFVWDSLNPINGSGTLLRIEFAPKAASLETSVWIDESEDFIVSDESFENIGVIGAKADISVSENAEDSSSERSEDTSYSESSEENSEGSSKSESSEDSENSGQGGAQSSPEAETGYSNGIEIEKTQLTINVGEETAIGIGETDKKVYWYSSNENIVRVEDGKIIAVAPGTATVTVTTEDGLEEAACIVLVMGEAVSDDSSESESGVIEVDSPRKEKEDSVPVWAWIVIAALGGGIICVSVILVKKAGVANKKQ
ncbi:MAG: Ig-like domain-containing protein [Oscillospiraceae bacterium]|nr:Ig-like domain-containing protein [Oscillospiraceae bacterium]